MRRCPGPLAALLVCTLLAPAVARATVIATEGFDYTGSIGDLSGLNGGSGWSVWWTGFRTNTDGTRAVALMDAECAAWRSFTNPGASSTLFFACDLITPPTLRSDDYEYVGLTYGVNGSDWVLGLAGPGPKFFLGRGGLTYSALVAQPGTTYRVVGAYDIAHASIALWVDPGPTAYYDVATGANDALVLRTNEVGLPPGDQIRFELGRSGMAYDHIVLGTSPLDVGLWDQNVLAVSPTPHALALRLVGPNPARGGHAPALAVSLAADGPARLEVVDVSGRRVAAATFAAGTARETAFTPPVTLAAGVYFARLTQGAQVRTVRFAVME